MWDSLSQLGDSKNTKLIFIHRIWGPAAPAFEVLCDSLVKESKKISHDDYNGPRKSDNNLLDVMRPFSFSLQLWNAETETVYTLIKGKQTYHWKKNGEGTIKLRLRCRSKRWQRFWKRLFDSLMCPLVPFPRPQSQNKWSHYLKQWRNYSVVNLHMAQLCGPRSQAESTGVTVRLLPRAALRGFPSSIKLSSYPIVCFLSSVQSTENLWIISANSLIVEMKSRKRSFGKSGFSSPLKYSFRTPATELISCSFWSSIKGSSPN